MMGKEGKKQEDFSVQLGELDRRETSLLEVCLTGLSSRCLLRDRRGKWSADSGLRTKAQPGLHLGDGLLW